MNAPCFLNFCTQRTQFVKNNLYWMIKYRGGYWGGGGQNIQNPLAISKGGGGTSPEIFRKKMMILYSKSQSYNPVDLWSNRGMDQK